MRVVQRQLHPAVSAPRAGHGRRVPRPALLLPPIPHVEVRVPAAAAAAAVRELVVQADAPAGSRRVPCVARRRDVAHRPLLLLLLLLLLPAAALGRARRPMGRGGGPAEEVRLLLLIRAVRVLYRRLVHAGPRAAVVRRRQQRALRLPQQAGAVGRGEGRAGAVLRAAAVLPRLARLLVLRQRELRRLLLLLVRRAARADVRVVRRGELLLLLLLPVGGGHRGGVVLLRRERRAGRVVPAAAGVQRALHLHVRVRVVAADRRAAAEGRVGAAGKVVARMSVPRGAPRAAAAAACARVPARDVPGEGVRVPARMARQAVPRRRVAPDHADADADTDAAGRVGHQPAAGRVVAAAALRAEETLLLCFQRTHVDPHVRVEPVGSRYTVQTMHRCLLLLMLLLLLLLLLLLQVSAVVIPLTTAAPVVGAGAWSRHDGRGTGAFPRLLLLVVVMVRDWRL